MGIKFTLHGEIERVSGGTIRQLLNGYADDGPIAEPSSGQLLTMIRRLEATYGRDAILAALSPIPATAPPAAMPALTAMQARGLEFRHGMRKKADALSSRPDPATFLPISLLRKRAMASGPVPSYHAIHQWHEKLEPLGYAKTYHGVRNGVVMYPPKFAEYLARFRAEKADREAKPA
jgi:hypothetical protein